VALHLVKKGQWLSTVQPDRKFSALDPMTRINEHWPPVMIIQGDADSVPGSGLDLARKAEKQLKDGWVRDVQLMVVPEAGHMFDLPSAVGTIDLVPKWEAVTTGLDWLKNHV
jgi:pimeloyl-ACP methyl ester carboxylesterase